MVHTPLGVPPPSLTIPAPSKPLFVGDGDVGEIEGSTIVNTPTAFFALSGVIGDGDVVERGGPLVVETAADFDAVQGFAVGIGLWSRRG